ncbi:MAG: hypothetical protein AAF617_08095 [Bacteroidota bacterium]
MKKVYLFLLIISMFSCNNDKTIFLTEKVPAETPIVFRPDLIPEDKIIHKGIFNPTIDQYYYTLSNKDYTQFDTYMIEKNHGKWSTPKKAFFNSIHNDHGMIFSPDGNTIYFSSTRPTNMTAIPETWHIWKSEKIDGKWSKPMYVDIPNLRDKLLSHPTLTHSGTLYFHASNLDYSEMDIYYAKSNKGTFENAQKASIAMEKDFDKCTPYISPKEEYLVFASIEDQLDLYISFSDGSGNWVNTKKLDKSINTFGQGNPYVTPDHKFLFFTTGSHGNTNWEVKWVHIASEIAKQ